MEVGIETQTIASLRKFDEPDLASNSIDWTVEGISADPDSHTYQIICHVWNIEGDYDYCFSNVFEIVEELGSGKGGQIPILGFGLEDGTDRTYPLPGFSNAASDRDRINYWIFPINPSDNEGEIYLNITGCKDKELFIRSIELIAVDAVPGYMLTLRESEPVLTRDGKEFMSVVSLVESGKGKDTVLGENCLFVEKSQSSLKSEEIEVTSCESVEFNFTVPGERENKARHYVLCYSGGLVDAEGDDGEEIPKIFALIDPYPNPFNPVTTIEFHVPRRAKIGLHIYDVEGRLIRTLTDGYCMPGVHKVIWDGCNSGANRVASGVYFCRLAIHNERDITKKMVLLR